MKEKLNFLKNLATEAGSIMLKSWDREIQVFEKQDRTIVTSVDLEISEMVVKEVHENYPDHGLLTEETAKLALPLKDKGFIIDELDGTYSYANHRTGFTFQCAYYENGDQLKIGLIFDPLQNLLLYGIKGGGVFIEWDGMIYQVTHPEKRRWEKLRFGHHRQYMTQTHKKMYSRLQVDPKNIISTGGVGSKVIDFALGKIDAIVSLKRFIPTWDWAPGKVIAEELGYRVTHLTGEEIHLGAQFHKLGFGYLVCPPDHQQRFKQELKWIVDKVSMNRQKKSRVSV